MIDGFQELDRSKIVLLTGAAGFIGYHLAYELLKNDMKVIGFDNMNHYYDINLKKSRLNSLQQFENFHFILGDIADEKEIRSVFQTFQPNITVNLAAQAGVRYSIENPDSYVKSNLIGFYNVLECCRNYKTEHLLFASSSSVYGLNSEIPFAVDTNTDKPISFYAATKKSNEVMAYSYSSLYKIPATGLRFFTVYGPYGRPDMACFSFADAIKEGRPIKIFNNGDMYRDFTYIDDIIIGIVRLLCNPPKKNENGTPYKLYNIGNNKPVKLMDFIRIIEKCIGKEALKEFVPMQPGDVYQTYADITDLENDIGFRPETSIEEGIANFINWYMEYKKVFD